MDKRFPLTASLFLAVVLLSTAAAHAASVGAVLEKARELTASGQPDQAVEALREAQVDHPDAAELNYALGEALYAGATARAEADPAAAREMYAEAERMFGAAEAAAPPEWKPRAAFARAAATARAALAHPTEKDQHQEAVAALRGAIAAFDRFREAHPDHPGAQTNLDHLRLRLKELLQNPPEKQEGEEQQPPPENQEQPPRAYFLNVGTQWPGARVESEGNAARLVVPEKAEESPK
jgi:tetratricopeptide (TPR) repeat protein